MAATRKARILKIHEILRVPRDLVNIICAYTSIELIDVVAYLNVLNNSDKSSENAQDIADDFVYGFQPNFELKVTNFEIYKTGNTSCIIEDEGIQVAKLLRRGKYTAQVCQMNGLGLTTLYPTTLFVLMFRMWRAANGPFESKHESYHSDRFRRQHIVPIIRNELRSARMSHARGGPLYTKKDIVPMIKLCAERLGYVRDITLSTFHTDERIEMRFCDCGYLIAHTRMGVMNLSPFTKEFYKDAGLAEMVAAKLLTNA